MSCTMRGFILVILFLVTTAPGIGHGWPFAAGQSAQSGPADHAQSAQTSPASQAPPTPQVPAVSEFGPGAPQPAAAPEAIPLKVLPGVPLHLTLQNPVRIKKAGIPLEGRTAEPVYVFDRLVIPAGAPVLGRVSRVDRVSGRRRALAIANGDFTPRRIAHFEFDTLVLKDGRRLRLQTTVSQGVPDVVHLVAGGNEKKQKGRVSQAVGQARQDAKQREQHAIQEIKAPGKMKRLETALAAELPYHRQILPAGTSFTAVLKAPLDLGQAQPASNELAQVGREVPPGSIVHVRLVTGLSSALDHKGSPAQAVVSEPLFSKDHQLILPEGARLDGNVTQAVPARRLGRNGQLRFTFRQIQVAQAAPRPVEASLQGIDAASSTHTVLDSEGGAHAVTPKTRYIAPAIDVVLAVGSLDGLDPHNHRRIEEGLGPQGPDVAGGAIRGGAGFGLLGSVVGLAAHYRPVSAVFAFYGAGWSVYSHVVARGTDVVFAKNTPMEIRFGTHAGSAPAVPKQNFTTSGMLLPPVDISSISALP
jgi:type IV secretory pathway VirB10-like protein